MLRAILNDIQWVNEVSAHVSACKYGALIVVDGRCLTQACPLATHNRQPVPAAAA
jgi:hypothetical protein